MEIESPSAVLFTAGLVTTVLGPVVPTVGGGGKVCTGAAGLGMLDDRPATGLWETAGGTTVTGSAVLVGAATADGDAVGVGASVIEGPAMVGATVTRGEAVRGASELVIPWSTVLVPAESVVDGGITTLGAAGTLNDASIGPIARGEERRCGVGSAEAGATAAAGVSPLEMPGVAIGRSALVPPCPGRARGARPALTGEEGVGAGEPLGEPVWTRVETGAPGWVRVADEAGIASGDAER